MTIYIDSDYRCHVSNPEGTYTAAKTERDGNLITANGPAAAAKFAAALAGAVSSSKAEKFIEDMYK